MFQQLTGVNFIFCGLLSPRSSPLTDALSRADYGTSFFIQSGIDRPFLITVATGVVNVGMSACRPRSLPDCVLMHSFFSAIPGIYLVERLGRRNFLIGGKLLSISSSAALAHNVFVPGALWMSACNIIIGATAVAGNDSQTSKNVLVAFTL